MLLHPLAHKKISWFRSNRQNRIFYAYIQMFINLWYYYKLTCEFTLYIYISCTNFKIIDPSLINTNTENRLLLHFMLEISRLEWKNNDKWPNITRRISQQFRVGQTRHRIKYSIILRDSTITSILTELQLTVSATSLYRRSKINLTRARKLKTVYIVEREKKKKREQKKKRRQEKTKRGYRRS